MLPLLHNAGQNSVVASTTPAITNSLRVRASASAYANKVFGSPTDGKKWTLSCWLKRGKLGSSQTLLGVGTAGTNYAIIELNTWAGTVDSLGYRSVVSSSVVGDYNSTSRVIRDPAAHYHLVVTYDSTAGAGSRITFKLNNEAVAMTVSTEITLNAVSYLGTNALDHYIGADKIGGAFADYFDGVLSQVCFVDGQALTPSSFAATDSNNNWKPLTAAQIRSNVGTWGNNGFMLLFNDATSTTTLGYDRQVSDTDTSKNNWTLTNISVTAGVTYDALIDSPCNGAAQTGSTPPVGNYCVLNPLSKLGTAQATLSNANMKATTASGWAVGSIPIPKTGKWWCEANLTNFTFPTYGVVKSTIAGPGSNTGVYGAYANGGNGLAFYDTSNAAADGREATAANDYGLIAIDATNNKVWIGRNRTGTVTWMGNGSPSAGTNPSFSGSGGGGVYSTAFDINAAEWFFGFACQNDVWEPNFGQQPFTTSDSSLTGFQALCAANLTTAVANPSLGFKTTLATGANIDANVATARSGWPAYLDIKKVRNTTGSWLWQFSHDSTKEYAVAASSLTYQAISSLSGANNYVGYSIRIDATYGTAAGSVSHTSGADTTVTHGVGVSARQLIMLFPRAGGTSVKVYHPDLTSGKLLDLCTTAAETTLATIKTVTSTSFKIDTGTATGTYDYLVISELDGFFKLFKRTGNGSSDGVTDFFGLRPAFECFKRMDAAGDHWNGFDSSRAGYNATNYLFYLNTNGVEDTTAGRSDLLSSGTKMRDTNSGTNGAGAIYAGFAWAEAPFTTANAR